MNQIIKHHESIGLRILFKDYSEPFGPLLGLIDEVKHDARRQSKLDTGVPASPPFFWLKKNPVLSGLWLYNFRIMYQVDGVGYQGLWNPILSAGHLYNAAVQENLITTPWGDMETLISLHKIFFIGKDRPSNIRDCLARIFLSTGTSVSLFARDTNMTRPRKHRNNNSPSALSTLASVTQMFQNRYSRKTVTSALTMEDLKTIVSKAKQRIEKSGDTERSEDEGGVRKKRGIQEECQLAPPKLLRALRESLSGEAFELAFDYLMMHRICSTMLRRVGDVCSKPIEYICTERLPRI